MSQDINFAELSSTAVRAAVGIRRFRSGEQSSQEGNIVNWIWNAALQLGGFILANAGNLISFTASSIWGLITNTAQFIYNFNWNATDSDLNQQIQAKFNSLAGRFGGFLGQSFGYLACGVLPSASVMVFNEPLGAYLLKEVGEELGEEILEELADLTKLVFRSTLEASLIWQYQNIRQMIKANFDLVGRLFGQNAEKIVKAWGTQGSQPWSFAIAVENAIESIPNQALQEFVEEFLEEAWEGCVEAGYVVANKIDNWVMQQRLSNQIASPLGDVRYVEITPNRQVPDQRYIVAGREEIVRSQVVEVISSNNQIRERDIGVVYGTPPEAFPERRHKPELVLQFYEEKADRVGKSGKPVTMQTSFRLMNKSLDDFRTNEYALQLARRIWSKFVAPPFKHDKGKLPITYADHEKGYQLLIWSKTVQEARRVVEQVLDIQNHRIDDEKLRRASVRASTGQTVDPTPERVTVLGEQVELPEKGKEGKVTFRKAYINLGVAVPPIVLIDRTGKKNAIYRGE